MVEENLLGELGAIRAEYDRECARLEEILRTRAGFREITKQHLIQGDAEKIKQDYHYQKELNRRIKAQELLIKEVLTRKDCKTLEVVEASKERKVIERLKEQKYSAYRQEYMAEEQKFLDDLASIRNRRISRGG